MMAADRLRGASARACASKADGQIELDGSRAPACGEAVTQVDGACPVSADRKVELHGGLGRAARAADVGPLELGEDVGLLVPRIPQLSERGPGEPADSGRRL